MMSDDYYSYTKDMSNIKFMSKCVIAIFFVGWLLHGIVNPEGFVLIMVATCVTMLTSLFYFDKNKEVKNGDWKFSLLLFSGAVAMGVFTILDKIIGNNAVDFLLTLLISGLVVTAVSRGIVERLRLLEENDKKTIENEGAGNE